MIKLNVKEYCHDCPNFEAEQHRTILYSGSIDSMSDCVIDCKHESTCHRIEEYLVEQFDKERIRIWD